MNKTITLKLKEFFTEQASQGIKEIRADALKRWARKEHYSPTELHKTLKRFVEWEWLLRIEKIVEGHRAVYYGLNSKYRQWYLNSLRELDEKLKEIDTLSKTEKTEKLNNLLGFMMAKFAGFVPFTIHHFLLSKDKILDASEELETLWHWALYPHLLLAAKVCLRNTEETRDLPVIQDMNKSYEEYFASDYHRKMKTLWENSC